MSGIESCVDMVLTVNAQLTTVTGERVETANTQGEPPCGQHRVFLTAIKHIP